MKKIPDILTAAIVLATVSLASVFGLTKAYGQAAQPVAANIGQTVTFTVTVTQGTPPLSYQWSKGPIGSNTLTPIAGATAQTLVITNVQLADAVQYGVIVSNQWGSANATTTLQVNGIPPAGAAVSGSAK